MARPRTRCRRCGLRTKSPHGLFIHTLRVHKGHNWNGKGLYSEQRKKKQARREATLLGRDLMGGQRARAR
jgi:hypothetical protein